MYTRSIKEIQRMIDKTEYWDADVYDFSATFFGDEVKMDLYCDEKAFGQLNL